MGLRVAGGGWVADVEISATPKGCRSPLFGPPATWPDSRSGVADVAHFPHSTFQPVSLGVAGCGFLELSLYMRFLPIYPLFQYLRLSKKNLQPATQGVKDAQPA